MRVGKCFQTKTTKNIFRVSRSCWFFIGIANTTIFLWIIKPGIKFFVDVFPCHKNPELIFIAALRNIKVWIEKSGNWLFHHAISFPIKFYSLRWKTFEPDFQFERLCWWRRWQILPPIAEKSNFMTCSWNVCHLKMLRKNIDAPFDRHDWHGYVRLTFPFSPRCRLAEAFIQIISGLI